MENSTIGKKKLLTPEKAATYIPVFISSFISILVFIYFVKPQYSKSNKVSLELDELIDKKNKLDNLKSQYKITSEKLEKLNQEKLNIIKLITGSSKLDTLLTKLGEIAWNNNIEFTSIIPKEFTNAAENNTKLKNNKAKIKNKVNNRLDPLFVEGTKKYEYILSFKTEFVDLLSFLRELEFQDNIILIDDIDIRSNSQTKEISENSDIDNPKEKLEIKMKNNVAFIDNIDSPKEKLEIKVKNNVVLIDDIDIKSKSQIRQNADIDNPEGKLEVEMNIIFYGRT